MTPFAAVFLSQLLVEACRKPLAASCLLALALAKPLGAPLFALLGVELPFLAAYFATLFTQRALALPLILARLAAHFTALLALGAFERRMLLTRFTAPIAVDPSLRAKFPALLFTPRLLAGRRFHRALGGARSNPACLLAPLDALGTPRLLPLHSLALTLHGARLGGADARR